MTRWRLLAVELLESFGHTVYGGPIWLFIPAACFVVLYMLSYASPEESQRNQDAPPKR